MYLWCVNGKHLVLSCPPGTQWNNLEKQCVGQDSERRSVANNANNLLFLDQADLFESARIRTNSDELDKGSRSLASEVVLVPARRTDVFRN